jgi:hypothetical protein
MTDTTNSPSIQDRLKSRTNEMIGEIEFHFDEFWSSSWKEIKMYKIMHNLGIKSAHAKTIIKHAQRCINEYQMAIDGTDKQLEEGYSNFTKPQLKKMVKWWENIIADCNAIVDDGKTLRKYNTARNKRLRALDIKPKRK